MAYEEKFAAFIQMCQEQKGKVDVVTIPHPEDIGDDYSELIESLSRLADVGLDLRVAERSQKRSAATHRAPSQSVVGETRKVPLPRPTVSVPEAGADPRKFGEAGVKGMVINPIYAGVGDYARLVPDAHWVAAARNVLEEDGPDQFLVNLLHVLRRTFGCVEWGKNLPPGMN